MFAFATSHPHSPDFVSFPCPTSVLHKIKTNAPRTVGKELSQPLGGSKMA